MINKQNIITLGIFILVLMLWSKCSNDKDNIIDSQMSVMEEQTADIIKIAVRNNKSVFEKTRAVADLKTLENSYGYLKDSLKAMGIKTKELESALFLAQQTKGSGEGRVDTITVIINDTSYLAQSMSIRERFFQFNSITLPDRSYTYDYMITDSLSIVNTTTRKNMFSSWETKVRVLNANPKTTLIGITSLTIRQKQPTFVVGFSVGYGITSQGLSPFIGITATKPIISF